MKEGAGEPRVCRWCGSIEVSVIVHVQDQSGRELRIEHECRRCREQIDRIGNVDEATRQMLMRQFLLSDVT